MCVCVCVCVCVSESAFEVIAFPLTLYQGLRSLLICSIPYVFFPLSTSPCMQNGDVDAIMSEQLRHLPIWHGTNPDGILPAGCTWEAVDMSTSLITGSSRVRKLVKTNECSAPRMPAGGESYEEKKLTLRVRWNLQRFRNFVPSLPFLSFYLVSNFHCR